MIPVNEPIVSDLAKKYVNQALDTGWISSAGKFVDQFEMKFAEYLDVKYATTVANGTTALHIALAAIGVGQGDEVIMPDMTIISCPFSAMYLGAKPVLVDVDPKTGNIDPSKIEAKITSKTKAIMAVHLFGHPADMDPILKIAKKHKLFVVEDAAEAHGAEYKGKKVGSIGDIAAFSFYANKIVTTGEGGMVVTNNEKFIKKSQLIKNLSHSPQLRFYHEEIGYNYRFTNLQAALGLGHLEEIEKYIGIKMWMVESYQKLLSDIPYLILPSQENYAKNVYWMYNIRLTDDSPLSLEEFRKKLTSKGIDTRTYFYPLHLQPVLKSSFKYKTSDYPVSKKLFKTGLYLPSGLALSQAQINEVSAAIHEIFSQK